MHFEVVEITPPDIMGGGASAQFRRIRSPLPPPPDISLEKNIDLSRIPPPPPVVVVGTFFRGNLFVCVCTGLLS